MDCDYSGLVEEEIDRILTQYRESQNLLGVIRDDLGQIVEVIDAICGLPEKFDIATAIGDQLTIVGKRMGWPRCHCVCVTPPVFGFACETENPNREYVGFCEDGVWADCNPQGAGTICINDDDVYRAFVIVRAYQVLNLYSIEALQACVEMLWGDDAQAINLGHGQVCIRPGRALTATEEMQLPLAFRVLPIAPGIEPRLSRAVGDVFGFGYGHSGFCDEAEWLCPTAFDPYACN